MPAARIPPRRAFSRRASGRKLPCLAALSPVAFRLILKTLSVLFFSVPPCLRGERVFSIRRAVALNSCAPYGNDPAQSPLPPTRQLPDIRQERYWDNARPDK